MNISNELLDNKRFSVDEETDQLIIELYESDSIKHLYELVSVPLEKLQDYHSKNLLLNEFLNYSPFIPDWLDRKQLKMASEFYREFALEIMMLLGAVSLPTCYAASPGNKVLYLSEKIRNKPGKRLLDTAGFVIHVSETGAFDPDGPGYKAVQQIRLIHGLARFHILKSGHWDDSWGLPANEEDMAGTNLAFSYLVLRTLIRSGFRIPSEKLNAYLHLWKWIGYLMKIDERLLTDTMEDSEIIYRWIHNRNFRKSEEGISLTRSLIEHYREALPKGINKLVESQIKYFVGPEIANMIGLRSTFTKDLIIKSLSSIQEFKNEWLPRTSSYKKMKKDHIRLKEIYEHQ